MVRYFSGSGVVHQAHLRRTVSTPNGNSSSCNKMGPPCLPRRSSTLNSASTLATAPSSSLSSTISSLSSGDLGLAGSSSSSFGVLSPHTHYGHGGETLGVEGRESGGSPRVSRAACGNCGFIFLCAYSKGGRQFCSLDCRTSHDLHGVEDQYNHIPTGASVDAATHNYSLTPQQGNGGSGGAPPPQQQQQEVQEEEQQQQHVQQQEVATVAAPASVPARVEVVAAVGEGPAAAVATGGAGVHTTEPMPPSVPPPLELAAPAVKQAAAPLSSPCSPVLLRPQAVAARPRAAAILAPHAVVQPAASRPMDDTASHLQGQQPQQTASSTSSTNGGALFDFAQIASVERRRHAAMQHEPSSSSSSHGGRLPRVESSEKDMDRCRFQQRQAREPSPANASSPFERPTAAIRNV